MWNYEHLIWAFKKFNANRWNSLQFVLVRIQASQFLVAKKLEKCNWPCTVIQHSLLGCASNHIENANKVAPNGSYSIVFRFI